MRVAVLRSQKVIGWPFSRPPAARDKAFALELGAALSRPYTTDAHFSQYVAQPIGCRLRGAAVEHGARARIDVIVFDVDCPETHGTSTPAPESWRLALRHKMLALRSVHPGFYYYETRGGARFLYRQPVTVVIGTRDDAAQWRQDYAVTCAYLRRRFEIECDVACADWTRLFRLPRATRQVGGQPEQWPRSGDPSRIQALRFTPAVADLDAARRLLPSAFGRRKVLDFAPCTSDGYGVLYHALQARGDIIRPHSTTAYVIRCPREAHHSCGRTGDTSTLLYLPAAGEQIGAIHCLHAHCAGLHVRDWLREFTPTEIESAREAAGLSERRRA